MFRRNHLKKPDWLKVRIPSGKEYKSIYKILEKNNLSTVCQEARCPNIGECWNRRTATIMILGRVCTRACRFCAVATGNPMGTFDPDEPVHVAEVVKSLGLKYVVITSVDRDDLEDAGSGHYAETIKSIREKNPDTRVEALVPDFGGDTNCLQKIVGARPYVIGHNVETVERLTSHIRDRRCGYERSLNVLRKYKSLDAGILTKSGFMVGLGETSEEIRKTLEDLQDAGVDIVTIGQYLQPTKKHHDVQRYYTPEEFDSFRKVGLKIGIRHVLSGPLVRSSYRAGEIFTQ
ncbi:lipoyl synthase [candidate division WOR_3 bacterium SM23_42]|uniref:Lipoyl synthase n=1 Tax=candidate division WOR_3 bacterium SM23_42 TaxID=1703779 RepID=A0A0S8FSX5_UNCW3|nr:MAG: lipoyl synthase [candidate division WOR_3 bacterium SM23_42]